MALDETIKAQLKQYLELLESDVVFQASLGQDERSEQVRAFLEEIVAMSPRLSLENTETNRQPSFTVTQVGQAVAQLSYDHSQILHHLGKPLEQP